MQHAFVANQLTTEKQWAYRRGHSTELFLVHLTKMWKRALDSGNVVAVAFVDFRKAFDGGSHDVSVKNLKYNFASTGMSLDGLGTT